MQPMFAAHRMPPLAVTLMVALCLSLGVAVSGCSQTTAETKKAEAARIDEAKAVRAELEASCAEDGYTPGTEAFQTCVGRASVQYTNTGFSKAKVIHQGVKAGPDAYGVANAGLTLGRAAVALSDARVKRDLVRVGALENGVSLYRFTYVGGKQRFVGVLAQEVENIVPTAVHEGSDGFLRVDYRELGFRMMTWEAWIDATSSDRSVVGRTAVAE